MAQLLGTRTIWQNIRTYINSIFTDYDSAILNTLPISLADKQDKLAVENLNTNSKDIIGAINEVFAMITPATLPSPVLSIGSGGTTILNGTITPIIGNNGYKIYASSTENGTYTLLTTLAQNATSFQETSLSTGQTRWYKGQTLGNGGNTHDSILGAAYSGTTSTVIQLNTPTMGVVTPDSQSQITIHVSNVDSNSTYLKLEYKLSSASTWTLYSSILSKSITSQSITGLTSNTSYDFRWTAIGNGSTYLNSAVSLVGTATTSAISNKLSTPIAGIVSVISQTVVSVTVSNIDSRCAYVKTQYKKSTDSTWIDDTYHITRLDNKIYLFGLEPATQYNVRFISIGTSLISDSDPSLSISNTTSSYTNILYIDPGCSGTHVGTIANPLSAMPSTGNMVASTTYLFKRGTTYTFSTKINVQVSGVIIGAYGTGAKPKLVQSANEDGIIGAGNITIQDVEIYSTYSVNTEYAISFANAAGYLNVYNCKIHNFGQGVRTLYYDPSNTSPFAVKVLGCEVYTMGSDGLFIQCCTSLEVGYCNIYDVNLSHDYVPATPDDGDNIHLDNIYTIWVHNTIMDHSSQPGKFCLLWGILTAGFIGSATIEFCNFIKDRTDNDSTMWYSDYADGSTAIFRYCTFKNALLAFDNHTWDVQIYGCSFSNIDHVYNCSIVEGTTSPIFYNNTVYNCAYVAWGYGENLDCKNNIFHTITTQVFLGNAHVSDYNCYYTITSMGDTDPGANDLTSTDPLLNNAVTGDFVLQSNSPCIGSGLVITGYTSTSNVNRGSGIEIP